MPQIVSELLDYVISGPFLDHAMQRFRSNNSPILDRPVANPYATRGAPLYERFLDKLALWETVQILGGEAEDSPTFAFYYETLKSTLSFESSPFSVGKLLLQREPG